MNDDRVIIALAKGSKSRDTDNTMALLERAGIPVPTGEAGRKLVHDTEDGSVRYFFPKPVDVPTFVDYGAADLGICGLDVLRESGRNVYEPLLLPFGHCRLSVAAPVGRMENPLRYESQPRVATKYPKLTTEFFRSRGVNAEIIPLYGSVELAPLVGLSDLIVDIVDTGNTLRANGLEEIRVILHCQMVLIANRAAFRLKAQAIRSVIERISAVLSPSETQEPEPA
jgi:ATP phosphoribosyltransferase